ncbi:DarT1-associated NADAR antitoxin family protein [Macrococcus equi]|uniref:DarT1-associated NADAR antitoxin family protein n=1 Tax=Macrococcus equi TaxID=3395462 RepID=UPI0039BDB5C1
MAERYVYRFNAYNYTYERILVNFEWMAGFTVNQKQKSIENLHHSFLKIYPNDSILEVSSKSKDKLGTQLSAFNLIVKTKNNYNFSVEQLFQASKVFKNSGSQQELLTLGLDSRDIKRKIREINENDQLISFELFGNEFPLEPKTYFYNWLYIQALHRNKLLSKKVREFNAFTDIELNHKKSFNSQAEACSIYVWLCETNQIENALQDKTNFKNIVYKRGY